MGSEFKDINNELSYISYKNILEEIKKDENIKKIKPTIRDNHIFITGMDELANDIAIEYGKKIEDIEEFKQLTDIDYEKSIKYIGMNFKDSKLENDIVKSVYKKISNYLDKIEWNVNPTPVEDLCNINDTFDKTFNFGLNHSKQNNPDSIIIKNGEMDISACKPTTKHIRLDMVEISHKNENLREVVIDSLKNYIINLPDDSFENEDYKEELLEAIEEDDCLLIDNIVEFIIGQRKGCLPRHYSFMYLEYLLNNINKSSLDEKEEKIYELFEKYVKSFDKLEEFITEKVLKDSEDFSLHSSKNKSILNLFRSEEMYKFLPFIGVYSEDVFSTNDKNSNCIFSKSIGIKLNNKVENHKLETKRKMESSFIYSISKIDETLKSSIDTKARCVSLNKVSNIGYEIRNILLIEFFLLPLIDENYNQIDSLKKSFEELKQLNSVEDEYKFLKKHFDYLIKKGEGPYSICDKMQYVLTLIKDFIENTISYGKNNHQKRIVLNDRTKHTEIRKFLLFPNFLPKDLFEAYDKRWNGKDYTARIKFSTLVKDGIYNNVLFALPFEITFKTSYIKQEEEKHKFNKTTIYDQYDNLNIITIPNYKSIIEINNKINNDYKKEIALQEKVKTLTKKALNNIKSTTSVVFPCLFNDDKLKNESYRFIYNLAYTSLSVMISSYYCELMEKRTRDNKRLKVAVLRAHISDLPISDNYTYEHGKLLSFTLNKKYFSTSQGFCLEKKYFNRMNAISSENSRLDQEFTLNKNGTIEPILKKNKMAILMVTSFTTDNKYSKPDEKSIIPLKKVVVQVITLDNKDSNKTVLRRRKVYIDLYEDKNLFNNNNTTLIEIVNSLHKEGYNDFIYIARAMYSSKLNNKNIGEQDLYFMNESLLTAMKINDDIKIYPIFYNELKSVDCRDNKNSNDVLVMSDTKKLEEIRSKELKGLVPVTGFIINSNNINEKSVYKTLVMYTTPRDIFTSAALNQQITSILFDSNLKEDIVNSLAAIHFAAYEKEVKENTQKLSQKPNFKTNPYEMFSKENIISKVNSIYEMHNKPYSQNKYKIMHNTLSYADHIMNNIMSAIVEENIYTK